MLVSLNGETKEIKSDLLCNALTELGYEDEGFAVAVNGEFVPRPTYNEYFLSEKDEIDVVAPIAGG